MNTLCERLANGEDPEHLMNCEWSRLKSFKDWPESVPMSSIKLAKEGFYYVGNSDRVKCFSCKLILCNWRTSDVPSELHKRNSPNCEFVRGIDGNNIPIHAQGQLPENAVTSLQDGAVAEGNGGTFDGRLCDRGMLQFTMDSPKFPKYRNISVRRDTYNGWPKEDVLRSTKLAKAGFFFTGSGDLVRCFHCGIGLRDWCSGDDPWKEHVKIYKWCPYLQDKKGKEFIQKHSQLELDSLENHQSSTSDSSSEVNKDASASHLTGRKFDDISKSGGEGRQHRSSKQEDDESVEGRRDQDFDNLKMKSERLEDRLKCKICLISEVNVVFLPCGHLACCQTCAPYFDNCAICRTPVERRRKIFLS